MNNPIKLLAITITGFVATYPISTNVGETRTFPTIEAPIAKVIALDNEAEFEWLPSVTVTIPEDEIEIIYLPETLKNKR